MRSHTRLRGEPALALALLLGGWVGLRVAFWESPFPPAKVDLPEALLVSAAQFDGPLPAAPKRGRAGAAAGPSAQPVEQAPTMPGPVPVQVDPAAPSPAPVLPEALHPQPVPFVAPSPAPSAPPLTQRLAAAHNMVLMAGLSGVPLPPELAQLLEEKDAPAEAPANASEVGAPGEQEQQ
jgi:hypothetical protein